MPSILYSNHVYILSNKNRTVFYVGVTNDIRRRMIEHKAGFGGKFSFKYNLTDLLFMEEYDDIRFAIQREKQLKNWHREWKVNLIKILNPEMIDQAAEWFNQERKLEYKENRKKEIELSKGMPKQVRHDMH